MQLSNAASPVRRWSKTKHFAAAVGAILLYLLSQVVVLLVLTLTLGEVLPEHYIVSNLTYLLLLALYSTAKQGETLAIDGGFAQATASLLQDCRFLCNVRGMIVNMEYIERTDGEWFYLQNGQRLPIGVRNRRALINAYRDFHMGSLHRKRRK